ncbi:MAG: TrmH family RNA methyltransferase [Candidatus Saccharimonadales bacterium]
MKSREIVIIAHNLRSCHNVGSLLRTAEGTGVKKVYLSGYTPYPLGPDDTRMPHIATKIDKQIHKTALGAESQVKWEHSPDILKLIDKLRADDYIVAGLEQADDSISLPSWDAGNKIALLLGRETLGIELDILSVCDVTLEIPMLGRKESYNVVQAAAMALYDLRFTKH